MVYVAHLKDAVPVLGLTDDGAHLSVAGVGLTLSVGLPFWVA